MTTTTTPAIPEGDITPRDVLSHLHAFMARIEWQLDMYRAALVDTGVEMRQLKGIGHRHTDLLEDIEHDLVMLLGGSADE